MDDIKKVLLNILDSATQDNKKMKESFDRVNKKIHPTLFDVYEVYKKWIDVQDTNRIDIVLAAALTKDIEGTAIWLILVAPSGDWKSEQLRALYNPETCIMLDKFTSKTLISGNKKVPDLAPKLDGKIVIFTDFASMLKLNPNEKAEIFAQLRDFYDGRCGGAYGTGKVSHYEGLRSTWIIASTPAIDRQILIHQDLGTRETIYRPQLSKVKTINNLKERLMLNEDTEALMRRELNEVTVGFLKHTKYKKIKMEEEMSNAIFTFAEFLCILRANAAIDSYTGELIADVDMEMPTRNFKQLLRLFMALKSLREDYPDELALEIILETVLSSGNKNRLRIINYLYNSIGEPLTTTTISKHVKIGFKTTYSELNALWNMGICKRDEVNDETTRWKAAYTWNLDLNHELTQIIEKVNELRILYTLNPKILERDALFTTD